MADKEKKFISPVKKKRRKKKIVLFSILAALILTAVVFFFVPVVKVEEPNYGDVMSAMSGNGENKSGKRMTLFKYFTSKEQADEKVIMTSKPYISTIELTVSGSGTIEPLDRYEIMSLVSGDVILSPFEEGDMVNEDDVVFEIDHEEQDKSIESAENSLTKAKIRNKIYLDENEFQKTLAKYTVKAEEDGIISGFNLKVDDKVATNVPLGVIQNFDEITAKVPFNAAQFEKITVGDSATIYLYPSMYSTEGKVSYKSYQTAASIGGAVVYDVEITFDGSNITLTDTAVSATIHTSFGEVESPSSGTLSYDEPVNILAEVSGDVKSVKPGIKNGAKVNKGDVLFYIDTDDFLEEKTLAEMEYHDLELNLENAVDRLENYNIKSPISGTVISKNIKKGDTVSAGNNSGALMVIADMSAMKFTFQADETDIEKIEMGQDVIVTADAISGKIFHGIVNKIATEGTSSNGVSYYNIEVVIENYGQNDESGALRSGMNVSAEIVYEKAENVLCVPVSAVTTAAGETYVFVKGEAKKTAPEVSLPKNDGKSGSNNEQTESMKKDKETVNAMPENGNKNTERQEAAKQRILEMTPEGFTAVKVVTGVTDGTRIAILSGISIDDEIYLAENNNVKAAVSFGSNMGLSGGMMGGMPGGMPMMGGGMPGGGMRTGGGMPGGGIRTGGMSGGMR